LIEIRQTARFATWLAGLLDDRARARILKRLDRARDGNLGDVAPVGEGVSEMRIFYGPGYRVYFERNYGQWPRDLPSEEMISEALPEGVIEGGGRVSGFLYFQRVAGRNYENNRVHVDIAAADVGAEAATDASDCVFPLVLTVMSS
jgi:putative addiction module killer protein